MRAKEQLKELQQKYADVDWQRYDILYKQASYEIAVEKLQKDIFQAKKDLRYMDLTKMKEETPEQRNTRIVQEVLKKEHVPKKKYKTGMSDYEKYEAELRGPPITEQEYARRNCNRNLHNELTRAMEWSPTNDYLQDTPDNIQQKDVVQGMLKLSGGFDEGNKENFIFNFDN